MDGELSMTFSGMPPGSFIESHALQAVDSRRHSKVCNMAVALLTRDLVEQVKKLLVSGTQFLAHHGLIVSSGRRICLSIQLSNTQGDWIFATWCKRLFSIMITRICTTLH